MNKDDSSWLNICYIAFALIVSYVFYKAFFTFGVYLNFAERYASWYPTLSNVLSLVFGAASTFWLRSDHERRQYHLSSIAEMRKVTWPSSVDIKQMTWIVVVVVAIFSVILSLFDLFCTKILQVVLP